MARSSTTRRLADLTEDQWGLVTRQQAEALGLAWTTVARLASGDSALERIAHGVYRLRGSPPADHLDLRAAWMQLAPRTPAWDRTPEQGIISHRSAASVFGVGDLIAERHEFTLPHRRQTRRSDVRLHRGNLDRCEWVHRDGLLVTRPSRIVAELLRDGEEPDAVAQIVVESLRRRYCYATDVADALAPVAVRFGLHRGDGIGLLRWLLELSSAPEMSTWLRRAALESKTYHLASGQARPAEAVGS
jgi:hypothetical protein